MSQKRVLHFTLGPVQTFIADARRLRDYWAGSFILSLLAGHAMVAAERHHAKILFPQVSRDPLFEAIKNNDPTASVYIGSLPNRFKADCSDDRCPANIGVICRDAVNAAWKSICETVWQKYLAQIANAETEKIWRRQTESFWEMAWAVGDEGNDSSWLDMRKNWRRIGLFDGAGEGGDHCRLMGQYQELSGIERFSKGQRKNQEQFWKSVRENAELGRLNLPDGEYLSALAFIKRIFPVHLEKIGGKETDRSGGPGFPGAIAWKPGKGERNIRYWPSTSYIAALPWLKKAQNHLPDGSPVLTKLYDAAVEATEGDRNLMGETHSGFFDEHAPLYRLDGHLFHTAGIEAFVKERFPDDATVWNSKASQLHAALRETCVLIGGGGKAEYPSSFYAVLRMDGDSIGSKLNKCPDQVRTGLASFTEAVKDYFEPGDDSPSLGTLVYAGGDDVLAVLPVDTAIQTARAVRDLYTDAFDADPAFTLSGAIVFAHFKHPLTAVLRQSEKLLDDTAKDENGRNSLAISIFKPGGEAAKWASAFGAEPNCISDASLQIVDAATNGLTKNGDGLLSGSFFHGFRDRHLPILKPKETGEHSNVDLGAVFGADAETALKALIGADLRRQFGGSVYGQFQKSEQQVDDVIAGVYRILMPQSGTEPKNHRPSQVLNLDGGLIVRFLASEIRRPSQSSPEGTH